MLIYVGGKWQEKPAVREVQAALTEAEHDVISIWTGSKDITSDRGLMQQALIDYCGLQEADVFVLVLNNEDQYLAGSPNRYVEMGIALGRQIPVYVLGKAREDEIFHRLPWIKHVDTIEEVINALRG